MRTRPERTRSASPAPTPLAERVEDHTPMEIALVMGYAASAGVRFVDQAEFVA
jgi:hypothetical protein